MTITYKVLYTTTGRYIYDSASTRRKVVTMGVIVTAATPSVFIVTAVMRAECIVRTLLDVVFGSSTNDVVPVNGATSITAVNVNAITANTIKLCQMQQIFIAVTKRKNPLVIHMYVR